MQPVASALTIRAMLHEDLASDSAIMALIPAGTDGILAPNVGDPLTVQRPFLLVRYEGDGSLGEAAPDLGTWAIECHTRPDHGLLTLDVLMMHLKRRYADRNWASTTTPGSYPYRSFWAGASGDLPDLGYSTRKRIARFQLMFS